MRRLPPLAAVRAFEAAARHENFTLAAAELGMTQAAVSYQIRLLEERLGVPLFLRSKRRGAFTQGGPPGGGPGFASAPGGFGGLSRPCGEEEEGVLDSTPPNLPPPPRSP